MTELTAAYANKSDCYDYWPSRNLRSSGLWRSPFLTKTEQRALEHAVTWSKRFDLHKDLICEGQKADNLLIVASGWAYRYSCAPDGGRQLTALLVPGDIANLDMLLFERVSYSVRTLTDVTVVALPRKQALALVDDYPGIARTFTGFALIENAIASKWMLSLGRRSAHARIAHLLCEIAIRLGIEDENNITFPFPLRQEQIGDVLGLTNIHVNRTVQKLRKDGLIELCDRVLTIPDVAALRYAAGFDPSYLQMHRHIDAAARPTADAA
ncbi:Crp/Fnr family transcriptional regulator [Sphingomonas faeni]|uniref:Crp/Fnr family transcriptional regulator n=1 Tax=Sphingomonas faeni TaxID=185950 RepID=UPI002787264B|nr:Crp/Fnr family transcriptional regulator [Sphingomonas faeni]MDQ0840145.1 CRP-like cAMP-binding protein [Sphingomonas faeni]